MPAKSRPLPRQRGSTEPWVRALVLPVVKPLARLGSHHAVSRTDRRTAERAARICIRSRTPRTLGCAGSRLQLTTRPQGAGDLLTSPRVSHTGLPSGYASARRDPLADVHGGLTGLPLRELPTREAVYHIRNLLSDERLSAGFGREARTAPRICEGGARRSALRPRRRDSSRLPEGQRGQRGLEGFHKKQTRNVGPDCVATRAHTPLRAAHGRAANGSLGGCTL